ncbi:enoyl-CoA hydratase/isomerase family protein [Pseudomonas sp. MYb185]|uniref:enoyl-CoA hydratase/isomerase family protein n=1 Tax=Pseudomonas sp. MYb185 TaxID=1848729 RepID=UPI000CFD5784|nr:enoyl-CoA hydratase-related protein [Pseudomonas sp. MYb185]PRB77458.1 enoyl-CoA hydratase [Pseudomonas sp. MYb185]
MPIELTIEHGVARLEFNRPAALNAINVALASRLLEVCQQLQVRADVRVIVLTGAGRAFMAGGDLAAFRDAPEPAVMASAIIQPLHRALAMLAQMPQIVLGSVHGAVSGAGMSLALGCDMTLAADDTRFCLAYSAIAASLDGGGSWHLPRQIGLQRAMRLALLNEPLGAEQALELGLIAEVVPAPQLSQRTMELAQQLACGPAGANAAIKRLLRQAGDRTLAEQLEDEHRAFAACAASDDFREGITAFFDRRKPQFG